MVPGPVPSEQAEGPTIRTAGIILKDTFSGIGCVVIKLHHPSQCYSDTYVIQSMRGPPLSEIPGLKSWQDHTLKDRNSATSV